MGLIMKRIVLTFFASLCVLFFLAGTGCNEHPIPADLPSLYPCKITITQEGKPFEGATITLLPEVSPEGRNWIISGRTDQNGETNLVTQPYYPGVPEGIYKVLVSKTEVDDSEVPQNDPEAFAKWELKTKGIVPLFALINPDLDVKKKTPFEIKVVKGKNAATFEVGKLIRVRIN